MWFGVGDGVQGDVVVGPIDNAHAGRWSESNGQHGVACRAMAQLPITSRKRMLSGSEPDGDWREVGEQNVRSLLLGLMVMSRRQSRTRGVSANGR